MTVALLTNIISPHQLPLAKELAKLVGVENYRYIYTEDFHADRAKMGWVDGFDGLVVEKINDENRKWLERADVVYSGERDFELIEKRLREGKTTFYVSERWLKPIHGIPGCVRMMFPHYFRMCKRFVKFFKSPHFHYLSQGLWAQKDMMFICKCLTGRTFEARMVPWGYFVEPGHPEKRPLRREGDPLKVLWVGRMLKWKRVDTIIRAFGEIANHHCQPQPLTSTYSYSLTLVGDGPEKPRLQRLAVHILRKLNNSTVNFLPSQPIGKIREIMHSHDVYVLASNGEEGWGAALNEALEEGMCALGTFEAGSSSLLLPHDNLFHSGDYKALASKLRESVKYVSIGDWSAQKAAERMLGLCE